MNGFIKQTEILYLLTILLSIHLNKLPFLPPRGHVRNGSSVGMSSAQQPQQPHSASGTLKRGTLSRQQSQRDNNAPQVRHHLMKLFLSF